MVSGLNRWRRCVRLLEHKYQFHILVAAKFMLECTCTDPILSLSAYCYHSHPRSSALRYSPVSLSSEDCTSWIIFNILNFNQQQAAGYDRKLDPLEKMFSDDCSFSGELHQRHLKLESVKSNHGLDALPTSLSHTLPYVS